MLTVFTNGCFDGPCLHAGHLRLLAEAASLGDRLVVAVNSDASVLRLKGPGRPIVGQCQRMMRLAAVPRVSDVMMFDDEAALRQLVRECRPDVLVKGADWAGKPLAGQEFARRIHFVNLLPGVSTTLLLGAGA